MKSVYKENKIWSTLIGKCVLPNCGERNRGLPIILANWICCIENILQTPVNQVIFDCGHLSFSVFMAL